MMSLLMQKVKVKIENQLRRRAKTLGPVYLRLADNDTVPISVWRVGAMHSTECRQFLFLFLALLVIYIIINFTRLSVTTEVGALYGHFVCGWLGVVWAWSTHATVSRARGWLGVVVARKADLNWKL